MDNFFSCSVRTTASLIFCGALLAYVLGQVLKLPTWTKPAAMSAEEAASRDCSGHGFIYADTFILPNQSKPVCECNLCFGSDTCAVTSDCVIDVLSADPGFLEPFWMNNAKQSTHVVPSWYRMSYQINDYRDDLLLTPELDYWIRSLHEAVGNAVVKNKFIVPGAGSLHLINAAIHSLSYSPSGDYLKNQTLVVASAPYYPDFQIQTEYFDSIRYRWAGDSKKYVGHTEGKKFVEIITNPNNPDGYPRKPILKGDVKVLSDRVAWWPQYTPMTETADDDVMLFSLSKLTGHAGTRFGWALVKDEAVYKRMKTYVGDNIAFVSHDAQFRATALLKTIVQGYRKNIKGQKMFDFAYNELRRRWTKISDLFSKTDRFSLQDTPAKYCNFFKKVMQPAEGFAWVTCNWDEDCTQVFLDAGIRATNGTLYGGNLNQARLALVKRNDNFSMLLEKLQKLIEGSSAYAKSAKYAKAI